MKKFLKIAVIVVAVAFVAIQFYRPDRTNPQVVKAETLQASTQVPDQVNAIIARSCSDCHTNTTVYPWYSNVSPVSWFLANDISDGRRKLNFSVWNTYDAKKKAKKLEDVCEQVESGEMPLPSYLWIHRDAVLKEGEAQILCYWAISEKVKLGQ